MTISLVTTTGIVSDQAQPEPAAEHLRVVAGVLVVPAVACVYVVAAMRTSVCWLVVRTDGGVVTGRGGDAACGALALRVLGHVSIYPPGVYCQESDGR